ncbi:hypothetical protein [Burkholderia phage BCSR5]|nr:hypothetical protein [Burkholderia phage BCSR5]
MEKILPEDNSNEAKLLMFHIVGGSVVIASAYPDVENGTWVMERPAEFIVQPTEQGLRPALLPWLSMMGVLPTRSVRHVETLHIIAVDPCPQDLADKYTQMTSKVQIARTMPSNDSFAGFAKP